MAKKSGHLTITPVSGILIVLLFILLPLLGFYLGSKMQKPNNSPTVKSDYVTPASAIFNLTPATDTLSYFRAQVTAPGTYYATDDNMLVDYGSQGGGAPPRLILTKDHQVASNANKGLPDYINLLEHSTSDCIIIWSTNGFSSLHDWNVNIMNLKEKLTDYEALQIGKRSAETYTTRSTKGDIYVAYLPIHNKDNTSYFFNTCNTNNKEDFLSVIESLKFREDINYNN